MATQEITGFNLYHGTSTLFLDGIKEFGLGGQNILEKWDFYSFVREIAPIARKHCEDLDPYTFEKMANQVVGDFNFQHGHVYLSPSKGTAARYAANNQYGSEFVSEALVRVEMLTSIGCGINDLLTKYPSIQQLLTNKPSPLLITIQNAGRYKFRTENNYDAEFVIKKILHTLAHDPKNLGPRHQQDNLRLNSVVPTEELFIESIIVTGSVSGFAEFEIGPFSQ